MTIAPLPHAYFPHLLETIIEHASPAALRALRATSHEYRDRVDALPMEHLVFYEGHDGEPKIAALHPSGLLTVFRPSERLPLEPGDVRTVDIRVARSIDKFTYGPMAEGFTSIDTLRRMGEGLEHPRFNFSSVHTVVDFVDLVHLPRALIHLPPLVERYILHINVNGCNLESLRLGWSKNTLRVQDWVLVIHPGAPPAQDQRVNDLDDNYPVPPSKLLGHLVCALHRKAKVTIVGAEQLGTQQGGYVPNKSDTLVKLFGNKFRRSRVAGVGEHPMLRFVTLSQWWEQLGSRVELEGVWPPKLCSQ
ncbi:hypothetical protein Q8F55_000013 [Vanrija albida]|uniref:F-box domain-containing protein n=1 Tax=Vanrija albida TaxID=181172 RepID=A0ABR3QC18_9TREE